MNVSHALQNRPGQVVVELAPLSGAPAPGHVGAPMVAWADEVVPGNRVLVEYRNRIEYDRGLPNMDSGGSGWIVVHLSTGAGRSTTSLRVAALPAEVGATTFVPHGALNVSVVARDAGRDTALVRLSSDSWPPASEQANWRFCRKCQSMFFDGYPSKGRCPVGGVHVAAGYNLVLHHDIPGDQANWRYCRRCEVLFFDGYQASGRCAGTGHVPLGYNFRLPHSTSGPGQSQWRFCHKCQSLFYDGYPTKGTCPSGGEHAAAGLDFVLEHDVNHGQSDWRFCRKCHSMFFDGYPENGVCPATGHEPAGFNFVVAHDSPGPGGASATSARRCSTMGTHRKDAASPTLVGTRPLGTTSESSSKRHESHHCGLPGRRGTDARRS